MPSGQKSEAEKIKREANNPIEGWNFRNSQIRQLWEQRSQIWGKYKPIIGV